MLPSTANNDIYASSLISKQITIKQIVAWLNDPISSQPWFSVKSFSTVQNVEVFSIRNDIYLWLYYHFRIRFVFIKNE